MTPYWQEGGLTLYCGDSVAMLRNWHELQLPVDAIITDPPYGETSLGWDSWPVGWTDAAMHGSCPARSMWCFGSLRMFMDRSDAFEQWKLAQEVIWEKHNGTNPFNDRFRRVHEIAAHFYRGDWAEVYKNPQYTNDATARTVRRKRRPPQWGHIEESSYESEDGGPRLCGSVMYVRSCHGRAIHPTEKPAGIIYPLMEYSVPPDGTVLDCFAGSGVVLEVARQTGRKAIGIEINEEYCEKIVNRLAQQELAV